MHLQLMRLFKDFQGAGKEVSSGGYVDGFESYFRVAYSLANLGVASATRQSTKKFCIISCYFFKNT